MMKHTTSAVRLAAVLLLCVGVMPLAAQQGDSAQILGGVGLRVGFAFETSDLPVYAGSGECGEFTSGDALVLSLDARLVFPSLLGKNLGADTRLRGAYSSGRLTALPVVPTRIQDGETGELVTLDRELRLDSKAWSVALDLLARYQTGRLAIGLGPSLGYRLAAAFEQTDNVLGPGDYRFPDGQPSHPMTTGPRLSTSSLSFGPMLDFTYALSLGPRTIFTPELSIRYDLLSPVQDAVWRSAQIGAGGAILFDLTSVAAPPVVASAPLPPQLAASIDVFAIDNDGERMAVPTVHVREILYRQHAPLLPVIFFEHDSAVIPSRYVPIARSQTDSFRIAALAGRNVLQIQHQALNIIGLRMRRNQSVQLTLYGSTSEGEEGALGRRRAAAVQRYLEDVWGLDPSRLRIADDPGPMDRSNEATEDGRADNRRVELAASEPDLFASVLTEEIEQQFDPPLLQMNPTFDAEAGIRTWRIVVRQGEEELARFSNTDRAAEHVPEIVWDFVRDRLDSTLSPVEAELLVEDSTGQTIVVRTQVPLLLDRSMQVIDKRIELHGDHERIAYSLVAFDYRSAELKSAHGSEIRSIAAAVRPGAVVTVTGYTDRIGDERLNAALSTQRAERVAAALRNWLEALGIQDVTVRSAGAGVETARFDNDLPEGRVLSRGAGVVIDQRVAGEEE